MRVPWTDEQKLAAAERMRERWKSGAMEHSRRKPAENKVPAPKNKRSGRLRQELNDIHTEEMAKVAPQLVTKVGLPIVQIHADWERLPLDVAEHWLGELNKVVKTASTILNRRMSGKKSYRCAICSTLLLDGQQAWKDNTRRQAVTNLVDPAYLCSTGCSEEYRRRQLEASRQNRLTNQGR